MKTNALSFILAVLALLYIVPAARSQQVSLGGKAGAAISYWSNTEKSHEVVRSPYIGVAGGFISNISFSKYFGLQMELIFQQKGMRFKSTGVEADVSRVHLNCLELPVLFQLTIPLDNDALYFTTGGYFAVAVNGKVYYEYTIEGEQHSDKFDVEFGKGQVSRIDAGIPFGMGMMFKAGAGKLVADLRYELGLIGMINEDDVARSDQNFWRCGTISLAYLLPVGKK